MTTADILNALIEREGGFQDDIFDPGNADGTATKYGITGKTLGLWRKLGRLATKAEVAALSKDEAFQIYENMFLIKTQICAVPGERLRSQLLDFAVNSGPARAIRWLQRAIGTPVTGRLDSATMTALQECSERTINNALVGARCRMIDDWSDAKAGRKTFEEGVESRAISFFIG